MTIKILPTQQLIVFLYKQQHRVKDLYICMRLKQEGGIPRNSYANYSIKIINSSPLQNEGQKVSMMQMLYEKECQIEEDIFFCIAN